MAAPQMRKRGIDGNGQQECDTEQTYLVKYAIEQ